MAESADHAYERAFADHWSDVFRFALAWTNDWSAAEDLAQEAFLRLWDRRTRLDWNRPVLPWLLVTTRRLATDRFRQLRRRLGSSSSDRAADPVTSDEAIHDRWLDVAAGMAILSPLYQQGRTWSFSASRTRALAGAFSSGLRSAGVIPSMKHFPGLGLATLNTDLHMVSIRASRTALAPGLLPYRAAIAAGIPLIMLSNATYRA